MVVAQHASEALAPLNWVTGPSGYGCRLRYSICETLVIALGMVMRHELVDGVLKRCVPKEDHPAQTLRFD